MPLLSDRRKRKLQADVLAACAEVTRALQQLDLSPADSETIDFRQPVLDAVYSALQQHAREQTALRSAAARLPDDLLVDWFAHLGVWDRIRAATMCHRWRAVSLNAPGRLWSTIPMLANLDAWGALLDRASAVPVSLERIRLDKHDLNQVFAILKQHMHHVKDLDLMTPQDLEIPATDWEDHSDYSHNYKLDGICRQLSHFLDKILQLPAPALERIFVFDATGTSRHALPILGAPGLRSVELHNGFELSCLASCAAPSALRTLVLNPLPSEGFPGEDWPLLSSFPALEVLIILLETATPPDIPRLYITLPPTLRHLRLELPTDIFRLLINSLIPSIGRVPHWEITFFHGYPTLRELLPLLPSAFTCLSFDSSYSDSIDFMITEHTGEQRIVRDVELDGNWQQMLLNVEKLCCSIQPTYSRLSSDDSITFPALRELTFDMSPDDHQYRKLKWPYGACPHLRTVRVRAYLRRGMPDVELPAVVKALSRLLGSKPQRRLTLLEFDNIHIVCDTDQDVASSLDTFTETLSLRSDGDSWPECHRVWNTQWDKLLESRSDA